jgi:hypothetical protein
MFLDGRDGQKKTERWVCGRLLKEIVCGAESLFVINYLEIDLEFVDREYIPILARCSSSALRSLELYFTGISGSMDCYAILDQFFSQCN